ncbi:MAG: hypothetical protein ABL940_12870 [Bacteroidia bacterium]
MIFKAILALHILAGATGLIAGTINMVRKKGDKLHVLFGKAFLYGMLTAGCCSFALAVIHPSLFLFMVGVFTIYLVGTGERYLFLKQLHLTQKPLVIDWALTIFMAIGGLTLIGAGIHGLINGNTFGLVYVVFGGSGLKNVYDDVQNYQGKITNKNYWLLVHIGRMSGGYIAAFTAFLVTNSDKFPVAIQGTILWLLPTIIFVPLIVYWSKKVKIIPVVK